MKPATAALCLALLTSRAHAQTIPGLDADRVVGAAGMDAVAQPSALGLPANPATIGAFRTWSVGFSVGANPVTDVVERSIAGARQLGRLGLAVRMTSRSVRNLFEDPALDDGPDLRVGSAEYAVGASFLARRWLRLGFVASAANSQVLSSSGSGFGYRVGLDVAPRWVRAGITYGDADIAMSWRSLGGVRERLPGTKRLSLGAGTPSVRIAGLDPSAAIEWNRDVGLNAASWLRAAVSLGALNGGVRVIAGLASCAEQPSAGFSEAGVVINVDWLQVQLGTRFGADPVPGNSITLGVGIHSR